MDSKRKTKEKLSLKLYKCEHYLLHKQTDEDLTTFRLVGTVRTFHRIYIWKWEEEEEEEILDPTLQKSYWRA